MAIYSSILAWRIPWTEEPGVTWSHKKSDTTEQLTLSHLLQNPLILQNLITFILFSSRSTFILFPLLEFCSLLFSHSVILHG